MKTINVKDLMVPLDEYATVSEEATPVSYTHLTLPTTPYV